MPNFQDKKTNCGEIEPVI